jgi:alpha-D-xyloside xylohydrolase
MKAMKFTHGYWLTKEGVSMNNPVEVRDIRIKDNSITVYAACRAINHRWDTLDGALITVEYSSPLPDVIRVKAYHHKGVRRLSPEFLINEDKNTPLEICDDEKEIKLTTGDLELTVRKKGWKIEYSYKGKRMTGNSYRSTSHVTVSGTGAFMREQLDLSVGECVYGLGERFSAFVKNGQVVDIWNEDAGTCSEQAYKNIPFYVTNKGYGVLVNHPEKVSFEVASEDVSKVQFSVPGEYIEYFIIGGGSIKQCLNNYTALTGRPALPPAWSFGLWLTTSFTTSYDEKTVSSFIDGMKSRDLPLHVFHFDCFWMKEYQWCDFEWDKDMFPEPEEMLKRLKAKGLRICAWINPYIAQKSILFDEGAEYDYLVKTKDGSIWQWDRWQAGMGLVDFTNPHAIDWFKSKLKKLIDMGVDCFKTDFGERIPVNAVYFDGSDSVKMHNYYTYLYNKAVYEVLSETLGISEALLFARSATVGSQQFPVHWGGDCAATYESMAETLRGGLSLCLSGFGFWSHDIGGFIGTATPDLYKRWVAFGLLSSHSRLHGNTSYRVPWLYDEESVDVLRFFTKLKCRLMPYIYAQSCKTASTGVPLMRAMVLEFNDDMACKYLDQQYMLGESLLVAPIFNSEGEVSFYVPQGTWTNFFTGERIEGGRWITEKHGYLSVPLLVRSNSIIAMGNDDTKPDYDYTDDVIFHVFEIDDGMCAATEIISISGEKVLDVCVKREGSKIFVEADGICKRWSVYLRGIRGVESVVGGNYIIDELGVKIIPDESASPCMFILICLV